MGMASASSSAVGVRQGRPPGALAMFAAVITGRHDGPLVHRRPWLTVHGTLRVASLAASVPKEKRNPGAAITARTDIFARLVEEGVLKN